MREIFQTSEFYGHAYILKRYAGVSHLLPLPFGVQHGYSFIPGDYDVIGVSQHRKAEKLWVWSEQDRDDLSQVLPGIRVEAYGAPFVYLHNQLGLAAAVDTKRSGSIVFTPHSSEAVKIDGKHRDISDFLEGLDEEYHPIDICMYYKDIEHGFHDEYLKKGFNIFALSNSRNEKNFLFNFIEKSNCKKYAFVGGFSTAALYCAYLGLPVFKIPIQPKTLMSKNTWHNAMCAHEVSYTKEKKRILESEFFGKAPAHQRAFAAKCLGDELILSEGEARTMIIAERKGIQYKRSCLSLVNVAFKKTIKRISRW